MIRVDKIIIDLDGKKLELTLNEVNELYSQLKNLCGDNGYYIPSYPIMPNLHPWVSFGDTVCPAAKLKGE